MRRAAKNHKDRKSRQGRKRARSVGAGRRAFASSAAAGGPRTADRPASGQYVAESERPRMGLEASVEMPVTHEWTIQSYDSKLPPVLSTPAMIGMMELAAARAVQPELSLGAITVGTRIEVDHLKPVTLGATVRARARLVGHEGRFLVFEVEARSGPRVIGRGRVFRAIVEPAKFTGAAEERSR
jgi:fluoroacetyl-CoA thioesterase